MRFPRERRSGLKGIIELKRSFWKNSRRRTLASLRPLFSGLRGKTSTRSKTDQSSKCRCKRNRFIDPDCISHNRRPDIHRSQRGTSKKGTPKRFTYSNRKCLSRTRKSWRRNLLSMVNKTKRHRKGDSGFGFL